MQVDKRINIKEKTLEPIIHLTKSLRSVGRKSFYAIKTRKLNSTLALAKASS